MADPLKMTPKNWGLLFLLSSFWGSSFIAHEVILTHYGPLTTVAFRVAGGALILLPLLLLLGHTIPKGFKVWRFLFVIGCFTNALPFSLMLWSQQYIDAGMASIMNATTPIMTVILAHFLTQDEKVTPRKIFGITIGFLGILILFNPGALSFSGMAFWGQLGMLGTATFYAFGVIFLRKLTDTGLTPYQGAFGQLATSSVIMIPIAWVAEDFTALSMPNADVITALLMLTIFCSAIAYLIFFKLTKEAGATNASLVTVTIPPFTIIMGVILLDESFGGTEFAGIALITIGLLIMNGYINLKKRRKS
ncbi:DMT family transporter [Temperatibacter marinus]|uniref:DMT family transporter n=1 Tax=Temperatibacter marinus TaxID=1456591 RepID=A0AA52EEC8_9PROT|nr:DMT family transporter [Temperatibacter marinus]WND03917.1 DMT family transporter [Temperatibacter marinus]